MISVRVLDVSLGALWWCFPCCCPVLSPGDVVELILVTVTPAVTYQSTGYLGPRLLVTNV